jgi:hypothetical protein
VQQVEEMMPASSKPEQRHCHRVRLSFLVRVRPSQPTIDEFDEVVVTLNSCRCGCYFTTDSVLYKKHLRLFVTLPYSNSFGAINRDYVGEVLRVDNLKGDRVGVAVKLLTTIGLAIPNHPSTPASDISKRLGPIGQGPKREVR